MSKTRLSAVQEQFIQQALDRLHGELTIVIIAHRLSTIRNAHRILVLANGEIVEEGTHESLLEKRGEYFKFYSMQFKDENRNGIEKTVR